MLLLGTFSSLVALAAAAAAGPHQVKEAINHPNDWTRLRQAPKDHILKLRIGLPQRGLDELERHLYEVSDPDHHRYGRHLSKEEVEALVAPQEKSVRLVDEWLAEHGFVPEELTRSAAGDWVTMRVSVGKAEQMLDTEYYVWEHAQSGDQIVRTLGYGVPGHLHDHIDLVQPTTSFSRSRAFRSSVQIFKDGNSTPLDMHRALGTITAEGVTVDASCNTTITPTCLNQLYNAVGYIPSTSNNNSIGIAGFDEQFVNNDDLQSFYKDFVPVAVGSSYTEVSINGGENNQTLSEAGEEADLDSQYGFGLTHPTPGYFFSTGGFPPSIPNELSPTDTNEPYVEFVEYLLDMENPPQTISTSYGDFEDTVPLSYAQRVCTGFAQLGARGVSVLFASGDLGVGDGNPDPATQQCISNDGRNVTQFLPFFPPTCPFVTSVGATGNIPEVASTIFGSSGGFSNVFTRPAYQNTAVSTYLSEHLTEGAYEGLFNTSGRGFPDVSAMGQNFLIYFQGNVTSVEGTSTSTPTFASIVSCLNDARISAGKSPLGFLNPFLYSKGYTALNDITIGNNPGCGTPGFNATVGWDPVTGLGTPDLVCA